MLHQPLLVNFGLEYASTKIKENIEGLELNGTQQLLVHADGINLSGESINRPCHKEKHRSS
jgi:hypothetical protein